MTLKIILIFQYLVLWQKKLYEAKNKNKNNELLKEIKNRLSNLKDEIKKCLKMKQKFNNQIKY